jgi:hypothetical protein
MEKWKKVYESAIMHRAEIVKSVLEDMEMPAIVLNKKDSNYHFGHYEVHVSQDHVIKALKIIDEDIRFE